MKKEWKKPFVKWVILKGVNVVCASDCQNGDGNGVVTLRGTQTARGDNSIFGNNSWEE